MYDSVYTNSVANSFFFFEKCVHSSSFAAGIKMFTKENFRKFGFNMLHICYNPLCNKNDFWHVLKSLLNRVSLLTLKSETFTTKTPLTENFLSL